MGSISARRASDDDLDALAVMNRQLIEDEGHENDMSLEQLRARMRGFVRSDYEAYVFEEDEAVVGYALVNRAEEPLYLRQFFIRREERRRGLGTLAFSSLLAELKADTIDVDVLVWNRQGIEFWRSLGFEERSIRMRFREKGPT